MSLYKNLVTSESVAAGHPDKVADQISDAVLDEYLFTDPFARAAIETLVAKDNVIIAGEVFGPNIKNSRIESIVRNTIKDQVNVNNPLLIFFARYIRVICLIPKHYF